MEIGYFTPPAFTKRQFDLKELNDSFGKKYQYSSKGRWCLYHILKSLNVRGPVLLPVYCCSTVLEPLNRLGLKYYFYDIQEKDCNADFNSIVKQADKHNPDCIIAISMYGNPCCLPEIEDFCKERGILMIDDAAQSIGASVNGRKVGTFGDAGFFSLSPGKPNAGHMGGFFWTSKDYTISYRYRPFLHKIVYWDFSLNRLHRQENIGKILPKIINRLAQLLLRKVDISFDNFSSFESGIIGGVIYDSFNLFTPSRTLLSRKLNSQLKETDLFYQIIPVNTKSCIGIAHKYIFVCKSIEIADNLISYMRKSNIICQKGYKMLAEDMDDLTNASHLSGRIVEIPLDPDENSELYILDNLNSFIQHYGIY